MKFLSSLFNKLFGRPAAEMYLHRMTTAILDEELQAMNYRACLEHSGMDIDTFCEKNKCSRQSIINGWTRVYGSPPSWMNKSDFIGE